MRTCSKIGVLALTAGLVICGCTLTTPYSLAPRATIEDITEGSPTNPSYFVVAVDGRPVQRMEGDWVETTPCAVVTPGPHKLKLEQRSGENPKTATVSATFQAGKRYRVQNENDTISVVEAGG